MVKHVYKLTDIGSIPADWSAVDYVSFGQVIDGDRGFQYPGAGEFRDSGHCLFLNAGNVTKSGFRFAERQFISAEKDGQLNKGKLARGDIVLTTRGTVGNLAYYSYAVPFEHVRINSGMVILRNRLPTVSNSYLFLVLRSRIVEAQLERLSFGSAQPQLTVKGISTLKIPLPATKAEQEAIAKTLSDVDALIGALDKVIAKKRDLKHAAMQQLLTGKQRLPEFDWKCGYKQTEAGLIPVDWEVKKLAEIATIATGNTPPTRNPANYGNEFLFVSPVDLSEAKYITHTEKMLSAEGFEISRRFPKNSILYVCIGSTIGKCAIASVELTSNQQINAILPSAAFSSEYLYYCVRSVAPKIRALAGEQAVPIVNKAHFSETVVPFPLLTEQTAIANVLSDMDAELAALEQKRDKTRALKQGMMQELLTGKTRLV